MKTICKSVPYISSSFSWIFPSAFAAYWLNVKHLFFTIFDGGHQRKILLGQTSIFICTGSAFSSLIVAWWCHISPQILIINNLGSGVLPVWHQAITWTSSDSLLIRYKHNKILSKSENVLISDCAWKFPLWKGWPFCSDINVLNNVNSLPYSIKIRTLKTWAGACPVWQAFFSD